MGKPTICICENKDADQLRGNREADQRLCFRYSDSTIPLLLKSEISRFLALFCDCTGRFVSDLVENHIVGFPTRRLISLLYLLRHSLYQTVKCIRWKTYISCCIMISIFTAAENKAHYDTEIQWVK